MGSPGCGEERAPLTFLYTTNPEREPTYTYSRNFGSTFEGLGMGLPLAALHAHYHGGGMHLHAIPAAHSGRPGGVHASFTFDITGERAEPEAAAWDL